MEVTGNIGAEQVTLENAATEETLQQLVRVSAAMAAAMGKGSMPNKDQLDKFFTNLKQNRVVLQRKLRQDRELNRTGEQVSKKMKDLGDETENQTRQAEENSGALKKAIFQTSRFSAELATTIINFATVGDSVSGAVSQVTGFARSLTSGIPIVRDLVNVFTHLLDQGASAIESTVQSFNQAAMSGAIFDGSVQEMIKSATDAGLTFEQFSNIIAKNSENLAFFEEGVSEGARRASEMGNYMARLVTQPGGLAHLGFTLEEANDGMLSYLGVITRISRQEIRSNRDLAEQSGEYLKNLSAISILTGKTVDQLKQEAEQRMRDSRLRRFLAGMDPRDTARFNAMLSAMPESMRAAAIDIATTGTAMGTEGQTMMFAMGDAADSIRQYGQHIRQGGRFTQEDMLGLAETVQASARRFDEESGGLADVMGTFIHTRFGEYVVDAMDFARRGDLRRIILENLASGLDTDDPSARELARARVALARASNEMQLALLNVTLPLVTELASTFANAVSTVAGAINRYVEIFNAGRQKILGQDGRSGDLWEAFKAGIQEMWKEFRDEEWVKNLVEGFNESIFGRLYNTLKNSFNYLLRGMNEIVDRIPGTGGRRRRQEREMLDRLFEADPGQALRLRREDHGLALSALENAELLRELTADERGRIEALKTALKTAQFDRRNADDPYSSLISLDRATVVIPQPQNDGDLEGRRSGSLGATGKLIEDFGTGTPAILHGRESVLTEDQLEYLMSQVYNSAIRDIKNESDIDSLEQKFLSKLRVPQASVPQPSEIEIEKPVIPTARAADNEDRADVVAQTAQPEESSMLESIMKELNFKIDRLVSTNMQIISINERQLSVQQGLNSNLFSGL